VSAIGSESDIVVAALFELARRVAEIKRHVGARDEAITEGDIALAVQAQRECTSLIDAVVRITATIKPYVIGVDGIEGREESLGELVIRSKRMVIIEQMCALQEAILRAIECGGSVASMFTGRFGDFEGVASYVFDELRQFMSIWMRFRETSSVYRNRVLYQAGIRVTLRAIRGLLNDPDLAHFVEEGIRLADWRDVQLSCIRIKNIVALDIDADSDYQLFSYYQVIVPNPTQER
jgi:hypothetical protein